MVDIKSRFIDSKLPLFSGLASNNNPEFLEAEDYQAFLANYQIDPSRSDLPPYDEILGALNEGINTSDWHHAEELQQRILKSVVCSGSPTQVSRFFGPEADNISSLCSAMTSRPVTKPVEHVSRPSHRGPTVKGVATVGAIVGGLGAVWWGSGAAARWATRNAGRLSSHPFWQRFATQVVQRPGYYGPEIPRFFSRSGLLIRGGRLANLVRTGAATRFLGYMTMAGWADDATVRLLDLQQGGLASTSSSLFWYYHGYRMALSPEKSFLIRAFKFGGREGWAVVERVSPQAAEALAGAAGRVGAGQLLGKAARGMGKLVILDTVGAVVFKAGRWMFDAEPVLDMEDEAVYQLMQKQTSENYPYTGWLANSIRWVDHTFMRWTYEDLNRIDKKELYKYLRHEDRLTRVGAYFAEQAAVAGASSETPVRTVDYKYLQFLVEDPKADPFLQSTLRQLLANPVSHEGGMWKQDAGTHNLPDVSRRLSDAIVLDRTSDTLKVKDEWAFKRWVDSLPVPVRAKGTPGFDELMERQFHPTPLFGDEVGEKGRRSQGLPLTFGQLYDSAVMLDGKITASPEILEIADLLKGNKVPEEGKYSDESVYLAKEFLHTNEAIDTLYFASTLRDPNQLDQQMARPLTLADRVTDLAKNVFGFSSNSREWQNRVPIIEGTAVETGNPNLPPVGPVIGWVELPGGVGDINSLQKEPIHILETDSRNFWLMMGPGYAAGMFETVRFGEFQAGIGQKINEKRAHMKETVERSLRELSHVLDENVAQIKQEAGRRGETELPTDEELRYEAYREMASSPANPGDLFGGLVQQAESMGLQSGEIGNFERRMTAEMVKGIGQELRRNVREFRSDMISRALFKGRTDEEIELESFAHLGPQVMPIVQKAKLLKVDTGKIGELSDALLALTLIHEIESGTYLQSVPEEHREAVGAEHQKMGIVVKNGSGWALNNASPLVQKMARFRQQVFAERKMVEERMRALEAGGGAESGVALHTQELEAIARKAFPPIDLETDSGQARATQLAVQRNPNGAVATSYRFQDCITRLAILGLLSKEELYEYRDLLGLSFQGEQR